MTTTLPELEPLAALITTVRRLEDRVRKLERAKAVPAVVPLREFPEWYRAATDSPAPPVTEHQLRHWTKQPRYYGVDWIVRRGRSLWVDSERFCAWIRRPENRRRVRVGVKP